jgi:phosphohistidine phosphatase
VKRLYLMRHAKSSWKKDSLHDRERPLSGRGRRAAKRMAEHLRAEGIEPDLVLCSSAARTRETLDYLRPELRDAVLEIEDGLYGASASDLLDRLRGLPEELGSAMLIGHNPGLERLALDLAGEGELLPDLTRKFPTAALAVLDLPADEWGALSHGSGRLVAYVRPRDLG